MTTSSPDIERLPDKKYFRIGEVSSLLGVDAHVLRYWEKEFKMVKPYRGKSKQRLYRRQDVQTLLNIRQLLHQEGYTISGARKLLAKKSIKSSKEKKIKVTPSPAIADNRLQLIKSELNFILAQLNQPRK
ncbi:MerR family transcriptional regulator [Desulfogranum marinum]|uniref:MerR family transcriptional regulator n=1 Tax=Desulfogranum marinum TaxID=453220 RepID=UPI001962DE2F|nr:MerR family transcriptional regulator [Desulfogranum marinum]